MDSGQWTVRRLRTVPVSYTHLDVYKRQVQDQDKIMSTYSATISASGDDARETGGSVNLTGANVTFQANNPVSYTHLDVYKRQV